MSDDTTRLLAGSGGGGGLSGFGKGGGGQQGAYTPNEEKDNLDSRQYATVIDLISEGEIEGLVNGAQSIFLDKTPLQNPDGSYNFKNVTAITRSGTQAQSYIPLDTGIENEVPVGVTVTQATPITRTITTNAVNAARVTINIPALQRFTDKGDRYGSVFRMQIAVQYNGGGYTVVIDDTIRGRTVDLYQRQYLIPLSGAFPVNIRVIRVTNDNSEQDVGGASGNIINAFSWSNYTEITYTKFRYPNSALVALRIDAEQFSNIPQRSYLIRGIKVAIPSNATVDSTTGRLIYSGIWNGTFGAAAWTTDPAWILWDLLVSTRYGFGDHIKAAALDKWAFYSASVYASALVSNGLGGTEPRFSCNVNIQTAEDAYKLIGDMCSVFRAMPYWAAGTLTVSQDAPSDPAYLFTPANVKDGIFTYSGSSLKNRPTVAIVSYLDLDIRDISREVVEDAALIAKYGVVTTEISAFACTSRSQARRMGKWLLYSEWYESEICSFTIGLEAGVLVRPGQVISIADPVRAGARRGGRISAATTTTVTADDITGITYIAGATLSVILPTGITQTRTVSGIAGEVFTVSSAFTVAPNVNSIWIYETTSIQAQLFRVLGIEEQDGIEYTVSAIEHNPSKYAYIEDGEPLVARDITDLNEAPPPPTTLSAVETLYKYQAEVRAKIIVSWPSVQGVSQYKVKWRKNNENWNEIDVNTNDYEILNITPGVFEIQVFSVRASFKVSVTGPYITFTALGKTAPPADVPALYVQSDPDVGITLNWTPVDDLDLQGYEIWQGPAWGSGLKLGLFAATSKKLGMVPVGTTQWWIKALDTSGIYSITAATASITITAAPAPVVSNTFAAGDCLLSWNAVSGSVSTAYYTIRYGSVGGSFGTAQEVSTVKGTTALVRADWSGVRRFYVAAVDLDGYVGSAGYVDVTIAPPTATTIRQEVIDNNVLLRWTDATATLPIVYYELRRGATWAGATAIGTKQGLFTVVFETVSGLYTYWVAGVDSAGNVGTPSSVSAQVSQPPDYILRSNIDSTFTGTKTNLANLSASALLACVDTAETWQDHFSIRSWTTLQDQIDAGYPLYALPSLNTGSYVEEFDYGAVLSGTKITSTLTSQAIYGSTTIAPTLSVKTASGDPYTDYANQDSIYATGFRYVKVSYNFTGAGNNDLLSITGLNIRLDVKLRTDVGTGTANAGDAGGTTVNFNIAFIDVEAIVVTPSGTDAYIAVYDFVDVPNPTSFKVLLFDTAGTRVSGPFSWQARGS